MASVYRVILPKHTIQLRIQCIQIIFVQKNTALALTNQNQKPMVLQFNKVLVYVFLKFSSPVYVAPQDDVDNDLCSGDLHRNSGIYHIRNSSLSWRSCNS